MPKVHIRVRVRISKVRSLGGDGPSDVFKHHRARHIPATRSPGLFLKNNTGPDPTTGHVRSRLPVCLTPRGTSPNFERTATIAAVRTSPTAVSRLPSCSMSVGPEDGYSDNVMDGGTSGLCEYCWGGVRWRTLGGDCRDIAFWHFGVE